MPLTQAFKRVKLVCIASALLTLCVIPPMVFADQSALQSSKERVKKRDFDERTTIACAQIQHEKLGVCSAKIARGRDSDATVVVTFANNFARTLYFINGAFIRANATMSGVGTDTAWKTMQNMHFIRVDDQRYEIPVDFIIGKRE